MNDFSSALQDFRDHYAPIADQIRDGNAPFILDHGRKTDHAIVLSHGLTDSPFFMSAIGRRFHDLGFNVVAHLLPGHGLSDPTRAGAPATPITKVRVGQWIDEIAFSASIARRLGTRVSMACLSTGGPLNLHYSVSNPGAVSGGLFFFSAALDIGNWQEFALRIDRLSALANVVDKKKAFAGRIRDNFKQLVDAEEHAPAHYGIGPNPYRYADMFINGAAQLAELIKLIEDHYVGRKKYGDVAQPVFIAHSEADETAGIGEMRLLYRNVSAPETQREFYVLEAAKDVAHASLVLERDVTVSGTDDYGDSGVVEKGNPYFGQMMGSVEAFVRVNLLDG